jgi:NAD(P)-dependent dehydrogenase (short-subunit alcohol dehydrogenase family)
MLLIIGASGGLGGGLVKRALQLSSQPVWDFGTVREVSRPELDVSSESSVSAFANSLLKEIPEGEALFIVNATGVSLNGMLHKQSLADFSRTLDVNVTGNFLLLKYFQPIFKLRPGSAMVVLSSVLAEIGVAGTIAYATSKSALKGMVRTGARELARVNARINVVELGYFDRGMIDQVSDDHKKLLMSEIPLGRFGTIEELFEACVFCLRCGYLTGAALQLNGGLK